MDLYIVTGASSGLGKALTKIALQEGHQVIAIARSPVAKQDRLDVIQQDLKDVCKISAPLKVALQKHDLNKFGSICLINNAGVVEPVGHAQDLDDDSIIGNIEVNLTAPMVLTSAFLEATKAFNGWRTIVNISSGVAVNPIASWSAYSAAKGGLRIYSHALAKEFKSQVKTRVLSFSPGIMDTKMQGVIRNQPENKFADVKRFKAYKDEGQLLAPEVVAKALFDFVKKPGSFQCVDLSIQELL